MNRKIALQHGKCALCGRISPIMATSFLTTSVLAGWAEPGETTTRTTFRRCTGGVTERRDLQSVKWASADQFRKEKEVIVASIAQEYSLFEIDRELDTFLDEIEEQIENRGAASTELLERFQRFCEAHGEKADRIGRFLRMMEARVQYCRSEASRLQERARISERKATQTKYMVMYYLRSRDLKKIEGREFTLRIQKNSQDSVRFTDETLVPMRYRTVAARLDGPLWERLIEGAPEEIKRLLVASIQEAAPSNEAIKNAVQNQIAVPGAEVYRGDHLRIA